MTVYITRCPACQQAFKINENTLQVKNGKVRCGFCQNVFNAREHLYKSINLEDSLSRIEREADIERQGIANMKSLADQLKGFDAVDDNHGLVGIRNEVHNGPERMDIINGGSNIKVISHPAPASSGQSATDQDYVENSEQELNEEQEKPTPSRTWLWSIIALLALFALAVKLMAANQNAVLSKIPQAESLMNMICENIICEPRRTVTPLDAPVKEDSPQISQDTTTGITSSTDNISPITLVSHQLQQIEGNRYAISVELKNNTNKALTYPILTVVLKGEKEDIITRRRITPKEYLANVSQTLPAQSTQTVSIAFEMADGDPSTMAVEIEPIL